MHFPTLLSTAFAAVAAAAAVSPRYPTPPIRARDNTTYVGPENGNLVIVGGNLQSESIWQRIIDLAGGPDAPFVVIPTAGGDPTYDQNFSSAVTLRDLGATNVTVVHTYDPAVADTDEFIAPILAAKGLFFGGGRQWRLVDAYAGTKTEKAFQSILDRGGVISGSSAGASIQASFLARGDTATNEVIIGDHTVGFGYLKNAAVDQHILVRNRHFDLLNVIKAYPGILGIGINEDTAVVVNKNDAEIIGSSFAAFYDGTFWSREGEDLNELPPPESTFYFLQAGDKYDLGQRKVVAAAATESLKEEL
ncbi:hypothetical protein F5Y03DRAFT_354112 [Xylaria venustula]|nr:hypothetical protein F5Y03DRAFT_354112 [Xylaria venustula]